MEKTLEREYHRWYSPSLGHDMELLIFGHAGARVLVFPTAKGRFFEWEDQGMVESLGEYLENGWFQLFCVDSVNSASWLAPWAHPGARVWRHMQYEAYLVNEMLPMSRDKNDHDFMITAGAEFGAYHAANFAFRHPHRVGRVIGMSGPYSISPWTDGYYNDNIYFNDPTAYIPREHDGGRLDRLRQMDIIFATGENDPHRHEAEYLSLALADKGVEHKFRVWDGWAHDWHYWQQMIRLYIAGEN